MEKFLLQKLFRTEKPEDPEDSGFVEMTNDTEGQKAIDELNGAEYDHKVIAVSIARPRTERQSNGGYRDRNSNSRRY